MGPEAACWAASASKANVDSFGKNVNLTFECVSLIMFHFGADYPSESKTGRLQDNYGQCHSKKMDWPPLRGHYACLRYLEEISARLLGRVSIYEGTLYPPINGMSQDTLRRCQVTEIVEQRSDVAKL